MRRTLIFTLVLTISISLSVMFIPCQSEARDVTRVSVDSAGGEANGECRKPSISSDGRWVAFESKATDLTAITVGNTYYNVYIKDTQTGDIVLVSKNFAGTDGGNEDSQDPSISADGRYVAFESDASDLIGVDGNGEWDVFVYDRIGDSIERISEAAAGVDSNQQSRDPVITTVTSPDGLYVAFESLATDLVAPATTAGIKNVFIYDSLGAGNGIVLVSTNSSGVEGNDISCDPSISSDGQYVAFASEATNFSIAPVTTANQYNVYLKDTLTDSITLLSQNSGTEGNSDSEYPSISSDGTIVAFESDADNLVAGDLNTDTDVFVWDAGVVELISKDSAGVYGNSFSRDANISGNGSYVAFESNATNLVTPNTTLARYNVYIKDISTGTIEIVSVDNSGVEGNNNSYNASLSSDGSYVAFESDADNLVTGDGNAQRDVFVSSETSSSSTTPPGGGGGGGGGSCFINTCSIFK